MVLNTRFFSKRFFLLVILACFVFVISLAILNPVYYPVNFTKEEILDFEAEKTPGGYVKYVHPVPSNESYCHFNYGLPNTFKYSENDLIFSPELGADSPYRIIYNVLQARVTEDVPGVTYATHVSANFVNYISELVRFWEGPLSVAAFVPHQDALLVLGQVIQYCYCIPEMSRVSLHLVFPENATSRTKTNYPTFLKPSNCTLVDSSTLNSHNNSTREHVYPVNVGRNAARSSALTKYIMVSDAELMPSKDRGRPPFSGLGSQVPDWPKVSALLKALDKDNLSLKQSHSSISPVTFFGLQLSMAAELGLASRFLKMLESSEAMPAAGAPSSKSAYVVPIFEVENTESIPRNKKQLVELIMQDKAVYFHRVVCIHCQKFPKIEEWLTTDPGDTVKPFTVTKREVPYNRWEPIYIGTKDEPFYSERLSWEGLQDKMLQMLEMCLMSYDFVILDGAFLVHWPGIKKIKQKNDEKWRIPFVKANAIEYDKILKKISQKYYPNPKCKLK